MSSSDECKSSVPFSGEDTWNGGYYELAIEMGPRSDERLIAAHDVIWTHPSIEGCYEQFRMEPGQQPKLYPKGPALLQSFRGVAHLPDGNLLPAGTFIVRESEGPNGELLGRADGSELRPDWLGFFIPIGALGAVYPLGGWPFENTANERAWREPLNRWLVEIGNCVFRSVPFRLGLIGFEMSGQVYAKDLCSTGIPKDRWVDYLWPEEGELRWYPANRFPTPER